MDLHDTSPLSSVDQDVAQGLARQRSDVNVPVAQAIDLADDTADVVEAACRAASVPDYTQIPATEATDALLRRWIRILGAAKQFPDPAAANQDLAWAPWRCAFAGFGYASHALVCTELAATQAHCPFDIAETAHDWMKAAVDARASTGWPLTLARISWDQISPAFTVSIGSPGMPDRWLTALGALHIARYARRSIRHGEWALVLRPSTQDFRFAVNEPSAPIASGLAMRSVSGVYGVLKLVPKQKTKLNNHHRPTESMLLLLSHLSLMVLDALIPLPQAPRTWVTGPHPRLTGCATEPGFTPVSLQPENVWRMRLISQPAAPVAVKIEPLSTCSEILDYEWPSEAPDDSDVMFEKILPSGLNDFQLPFDRICSVFHNISAPVSDAAAYRAALNATLVAPFLKGCREFPPMYICPETPTDDGATNTGKTTLAKALACVYAPGLNGVGSIRIGSDGAPSARIVLAILERHGTAAFDEFVLSKDPEHPLSETKILNLATGDAITFGKILSNEGTLVRLSAPLFISSKVVRGKIDMFNRSLRIELGDLAPTMNHATYAQVQDGSWSFETALHARAVALLYGASVEHAKTVIPYPPKHWRFHTIRAFAALLLSRDENISLADASVRIDTMIDTMVQRHGDMLSRAMDSGLSASALESGSVLLSYTHLFSEDMMSDETFTAIVGIGARPIREFLKFTADAVDMSASKLVAETYGRDFAGTERQIVLSLNRSLATALPAVGMSVQMPGQRGQEGWVITRRQDYGNRMRYEIQRVQDPTDAPLAMPDSSSITTPDADAPPKG